MSLERRENQSVSCCNCEACFYLVIYFINRIALVTVLTAALKKHSLALKSYSHGEPVDRSPSFTVVSFK